MFSFSLFLKYKVSGSLPKSQATGVSVKTKKDSEKAPKKEKKEGKPDVKNNSFVPSKVSASDAEQVTKNLLAFKMFSNFPVFQRFVLLIITRNPGCA